MIMTPADLRKIPDYDPYWIEHTGQVWSHRFRKNGTEVWTKLKFCHTINKIGGYPQIMLVCGMTPDPQTGKLRVRKRLLTLHSLVALAWIGARPQFRDPVTNTVRDMEVMHLQGDRQNPSLYAPEGSVRLKYGTHEELVALTRQRGRCQVGEGHRLARLTVVLVGEARQRAGAGESVVALAREYGVGTTTMRRAVKGETWQQVTDPPPVNRTSRLPLGI